ncbi:hypothetical protein D9M68_427730 [compost metagenome]
MTPQRRPVGSHALYAYSTNCLIDLQAGIIVDVEDAGQSNERGELDQDDDCSGGAALCIQAFSPGRRHRCCFLSEWPVLARACP